MSIVKEHLKIQAPVSTVWEVLLDPSLIPQWAAPFGEGIWIEADWKKGGLVAWKDKSGKIIASGIVMAIDRNRLVEIGFFDEPQAHPNSTLGSYREQYLLDSTENKTLLSISAGPVPSESLKEFTATWKKALEIIKTISEKR
ncbi:SRPBCC family protein [Litoribacter populi]|uniref:SRPBCC family protein n=1 Tax=Litoribacter populi TaxID=2598460 RepID=UPI00118148E9|nr:SRPBCC domain-containing protein [Litoribacter populi]